MTEHGRKHTDGSRSGGQPTQGYGVATAANYTSPIGGAGVVTHGVVGVATQSDALRVTDEMVERAAIAFYNDPPGSGRSINDAMKAALIAALQEQSKWLTQ